jgi:hypothetical protein
MINLPNISILQRLAVVAGLFLMWSVAFFVLVENARTYAEILVLIPVIASAALLGVRGGLAGSMVGVLGITIFHLIDADDPFQLLQGWSPVGVGVMVTVAAVVGYGRVLETRRGLPPRNSWYLCMSVSTASKPNHGYCRGCLLNWAGRQASKPSDHR